MMGLLSQIGEAFNEAPMRGQGSQESQIVTPVLAEQKRKELMADPEFVSRYMNGDPRARADMQRLIKISEGA